MITMYQRIRNLREDHDLTQTHLARALHVSQATYSRYESGTLDLPSSVLIQLALFYHTSIDYLLGPTDQPVPPKRSSAYRVAEM